MTFLSAALALIILAVVLVVFGLAAGIASLLLKIGIGLLVVAVIFAILGRGNRRLW